LINRHINYLSSLETSSPHSIKFFEGSKIILDIKETLNSALSRTKSGTPLSSPHPMNALRIEEILE